MSGHPVDPAVLRWYDKVEDESARLTSPHGRVERERTREVIGRLLDREPMDVVDVGGATGVHAGWLAGQGHRVTLVDPVPAQVAVADQLEGVTGVVGDARSLALAEDSYDLGIALGPLYHLASRTERVRALRELARVVRPGGALVAAAIGRYAVLGEFVLRGAFAGDEVTNLVHLYRSGENPHDLGFPLRHAHLSEELRQEAVDAGWQGVQVLGLDGPLGVAVDLVPDEQIDTVVAQACELARILESDERALDLSPHLLVLGTAP